jgi:secondary thiamine-phosphate synthase enzyme
MLTLSIATTQKTELVDITQKVKDIVAENNFDNGILLVFCPHTTGSILLNENWDADVQHDFLLKINEVFADDPRFLHGEGNSDAHIKTSVFGSSQTIIINNGVLQLGQWQGIYFGEWDGARNRKIHIQYIGS